MVINTLLSGDSLVTVSPLLPSLEMAPSVTQTLPWRSTCRPWGNTNRPAPMLLIGLPVFMSSSTIGALSEPSQLLAPQRSIAQISPCGPRSIPALDPHVDSRGGGPAGGVAH